MAHKVTSNWLIGLTRYPELLNAFPWLKTLKAKHRVTFNSGCKCGQKRAVRQATDTVNEIIRILATIPQADVDKFKALVKQDQLLLSYRDQRGNTITVTR